MDSSRRFGCPILRDEVLNRVKPMYHIFGHVHEGHGTKNIDGVTFVNASNVGEGHDYECVHKPIKFNLPISQEASELLEK
jgi:Icc-related predicted phosphoesterase